MSDDRPRAPLGREMALNRELGVTTIVQLMARGDWEKNGHIAFADEHGVAPATCANWAGEASRQLKALRRESGLSDEEYRSMVVARLARYEKLAVEGERTEYDDGTITFKRDLRTAIAAALGIAKVEGLERTQQQQAEELTAQWIGELMTELQGALPADVYAQVHAQVLRARLNKGTQQFVVRIERVA